MRTNPLWVPLAQIATVACLGAALSAQAQECLIDRGAIINGGVGRDAIPSLTTPEVLAADEAGSMRPTDLVLGVVVNGEARAYPHRLLWWHEIVNDVLGGEPIVVSFCPLTGSGMAHRAELHEDGPGPANFGVSGLLFQNNLILFDRGSDSLWSQMMVQSVCGARSGERLRLVPVVQSTWQAWRELYPETTVVGFDTGFNRNYDRYPYGDYDEVDNDFLLFPQGELDDRLPPKETVLGLSHEGSTRAYPDSLRDTLGERFVINDELNGRPIAVIFSSGKLAVPFDRRLSVGEDATVLLSFDIVSAAEGPFRMRDRETDSLWNLRGEAIEGELSGLSLPRIATYSAFWFAWAAFSPTTDIYAPTSP